MSARGVPIFVKIDVERYELNVIRGLQRPVPFYTYEVSLPEFRSEGLQCVEILGCLAAAGKFNYAVDCEEGLALERWLGSNEFLYVRGECTENAIEVFWKGSDERSKPNKHRPAFDPRLTPC